MRPRRGSSGAGAPPPLVSVPPDQSHQDLHNLVLRAAAPRPAERIVRPVINETLDCLQERIASADEIELTVKAARKGQEGGTRET